MPVAPRILVHSPTDGEAKRYAQLVQAAIPDADLLVSTNATEAFAAIGGAQVLLGWKFPPGLLARGEQLSWVHKVSAGVDDLISDAGLLPHVVVTRSDGALIAPRMVEYVLGAMFAIVQRFPLAWSQQRARHWQSFPVGMARGRTVGIAGLGDIGAAIARAVKANGMRAVGWRRSRRDTPEVETLYTGRDQLEPFVAECDFVVLVLPATPETQDLISHQVLRAMKPSAHLINVGRGNAVHEGALVEAIKGGWIAGAFLDVYAQEPLPTTSALWDLPGVQMTPHVAGPVVPEEVVGCFIDNVHRYRADQPLQRQIDRRLGY